MIDEETKQMILKKTWCHGQLVAPIVGILSAWCALSGKLSSSGSALFMLLYAAIILPLWSFLSYRAISTQPSYPVLIRWGVLAEIAYMGIFILTSKQLHETWSLLMFIVSGLLFVETLAFLVVVTAFRGSLEEPALPSPHESSSYTDFVDPHSNAVAAN